MQARVPVCMSIIKSQWLQYFGLYSTLTKFESIFESCQLSILTGTKAVYAFVALRFYVPTWCNGRGVSI